MRARSGNRNSHSCMKIRNWIKFIVFQRYFKPKCRQTCANRMMIVILVMHAPTAVPISSISIITLSDNCGGISWLTVSLCLSYVPSRESTKMRPLLKMTISLSGSAICCVRIDGYLKLTYMSITFSVSLSSV